MSSNFATEREIAQRIAQIRAGLPSSVRLIAVTKQVPVELMRAAYWAGVRDFGENQVQSAQQKRQQLADLPDITWHFIGHLQSNKAQKAIEIFDWIQSVDSLAIALRLHQLCLQRDRPLHLCLQVKLLPDPSKYGWEPEALLAALPQLAELQLNFQGLMTIAPLGLQELELEQLFQATAQLAQQLGAAGYPNIQPQECSMGMSDDYAIAARCGSTMVRVGRRIFGDRK